jgi:phosphatidylserine/phosphatidylglycerophosphate/cardiolipin synthase-like enzyme
MNLGRVFIQLAEHPEISAKVCAAIASGQFTGETDIGSICTTAGIAQSQGYLVEKVLSAGESSGLFTRVSELSWRPSAAVDYKKLSVMLDGASLYKENVHHDTDTVQVVLTKPPSPSMLEEAIKRLGYKATLIENTSEIFADMALSSEHDLAIATPFLDAEGAAKVMELFRKTATKVRKRLVVRSSNGNIILGLQSYVEELRALGVQVFNYWIPKSQKGMYETFHAKLVSSDSKRCYLGSANMTQSSFSFSMELGFLVEGQAAQTVAWVCEAMIMASHPAVL